MLDLFLKSWVLYLEWVKKIELISGLEMSYWFCGILVLVYVVKERENYVLLNLNY